jgi:hypothetical protein
MDCMYEYVSYYNNYIDMAQCVSNFTLSRIYDRLSGQPNHSSIASQILIPSHHIIDVFKSKIIKAIAAQ